MKIISYEAGRVTWLFPVEEFGPLAGILAQQLVMAIRDRYHFEKIPPSLLPEILNQNGLRFDFGMFGFEGTVVHMNEFTVFSDGIVAAAKTTECAEAFLIDIVTWLQETFGFRQITTPIKKINLSVLVVEFDSPLSQALPRQSRLPEIVAERLWSEDRVDPRKAVLVRMDFQLDRPISERTIQPPPVRLVIEQRGGTVAEQRRYYSSAPIATAEHVAALEEIDDVLSTNP